MLKYIFLLSLVLLTQAKLDKFNIDLSQTSVSGLSSGGYMAQQFLTAYSGLVSGGAVSAGGPFLCSTGDIAVALTSCMKTPADINLDTLQTTIESLASETKIDSLDNIKNQKIYLYSGTSDSVVVPGVMEKLEDQLKNKFQNTNIVTKFDLNSEHAWVTENFGNDCTVNASPFMSDCDFNLAQHLLTHIYGELEAPVTQVAENLKQFSQSGYSLKEDTLHQDGYVYIPTTCQNGEQCRIHVAFHGCKMTSDLIQTKWVAYTGLNEYAESNKIIVLYPQSVASTPNPNACWDWWGFSNDENNQYQFATKEAPQMKSVYNMILDLEDETLSNSVSSLILNVVVLSALLLTLL